MTNQADLEPSYEMRTHGARVSGGLFLLFAVVLAIIIIVDGGFYGFLTGIGFVSGTAIFGYLWSLRPHLFVDPRGVKNVGPFVETFMTWEDFKAPEVRWGLRLRPRPNSGLKLTSVHAFPAPGMFARKGEANRVQTAFSGHHKVLTTMGFAHEFLAEQIAYYEGLNGKRRSPATSYRRTNYVNVILGAIAAGAFIGNVLWILN